MTDKMPQRDQDRANSTRGASASKVSMKDSLDGWIAHHKISASGSLQKMFSAPLSSMMTCLVIGIALALPTSLFLIVENIKSMSARLDGDPQMSVFVRHDIPLTEVVALQNKLQRINGVINVEYISPATALQQFKQNSDFSEALQFLDENPLPPVYIIKPLSRDVNELAALSRRLQLMPEVEVVQVDLEWVQKLQQIIIIAERLVFLFGLLLSLGVLLTIGNTIRLAIESRREEIVVVKLVGATDAFVRRPLLYSGFWYGLMGAIVACLLVLCGAYLLSTPSHQLAVMYQSDFVPKGLNFLSVLTLLSTGALLGLAGAWLATSRHLDEVQPR